ncbi:MAG: glycosyltransferase [Verrucomicrobia bacterium]|nr:glycosyltransferase [Verrucomicrobiota bacterium]
MSTNDSCDERSIPKNILQFWHDKSRIPLEMQEAMDETRRRNGDYKPALADDAEIRSLLLGDGRRELLMLYDLVRLPSSRSDIARLVLLQKYGGFYLDASMQFHISLNGFLAGDPELVLVRRDDFPQYYDTPDKAHVMGGVIGAPVRSPFIELCIERLTQNLIIGTLNTDAWAATGPGVINQTLRCYQAIRPVSKLSFTELLRGSVSYRRSPGITNMWVQNQKDGIIDPSHYASGPISLKHPLAGSGNQAIVAGCLN